MCSKPRGNRQFNSNRRGRSRNGNVNMAIEQEPDGVAEQYQNVNNVTNPSGGQDHLLF
jgi:hypothetical protein